MARLIAKTGGIEPREIELKLGTNKLGRAPENDFQIVHPTISGRHCEIVFMDGALEVRDLDSTNGTFINGQRIQQATLRPDQTLRLGSVDFELSGELFHVAIPEFGTPAPVATALPDGVSPCANHPGAMATVQCVQCERVFCEACLKELRRVGGKSIKLCPECSGQVKPILGLGDEIRAKRRGKSGKSSLIGRLKETLRLPFGGRR